MKKVLYFFLVFSFLFIVNDNYVSAAEVQPTEEFKSNEVSEDFVDFIDKAFHEPSNFTVLDSTNRDVTDEFINAATPYFKSNDYKSIQNLIKDQDLSTSVANKEDDLLPIKHNFLDEEGKINYELAATRAQNVSQTFYHLETARNGGIEKEWFSYHTGSFSYDIQTFNVTYVYGPVVNISDNFGWGFTAHIENLNTSNSRSGRYANYRATYTMIGTAGFSIGDLPIGYPFNFGTHTETFTAMPSVLN